MKKTYILLAAAVLAVSCQKETGRSDNPSVKYELSSFTAVAEAVGEPSSKVEMSQSFVVQWQKDDRIYVTDGENSNTFKLESGEGQTRGTFTQDAPAKSFSNEVQAFYPASLFSGSALVWPETQTPDLAVPMYSSATLSGSEAEQFDFCALGGIMQIVFNSTADNITLMSIEISDDKKPLSGEFTIADGGKAVIMPSELNADITLDFGAGVSLGKGVHYFNVAVPEGDYDDLTITYNAKTVAGSAAVYTSSACAAKVAHNTVGRLVLSNGFKVPVTGVTLDVTAKDVYVNDTFTIKATVSPSDASNKTLEWKSDNTDIATIDNNGKVTAKGFGTVNITATSVDGVKQAVCTVNVDHKITTGTINGHEYVQIDGGVKWAKENIKNAAGKSLFFFWGDIKGYYYYESDTGWTRGWKEGDTENVLNAGFCLDRYKETKGNKLRENIPVNAEYDAARALWGGSWRLPTVGEFQKLFSITEKHLENVTIVFYVPRMNQQPEKVNSVLLEGYAQGNDLKKDYTYFMTDTYSRVQEMPRENFEPILLGAMGSIAVFQKASESFNLCRTSDPLYCYEGCLVRPVSD